MGDEEERLTSWQDWSRIFENEVGEDRIDPIDVTGTDMRKRVSEEVRHMISGTHPTSLDNRPIPDGTDEHISENVKHCIEKEWYDLLAEEYETPNVHIPFDDHGGSDFVHYKQEKPSMGIPHQGWKLRVAAYPDEARDVAEEVLPYLQENDIGHKVFTDRGTFRRAKGGRQEGKFITIYPDIDEDKRDVGNKDQGQIFKQGDKDWNRRSINCNTETAAGIIQDLEKTLDGSPPGLEGRRIRGKDGEEFQYGDTRIHMRYAVGRIPATILGDQDREISGDQGGAWGDVEYVTEEGKLIEGRYRGDEVDAAVRPDSII